MPFGVLAILESSWVWASSLLKRYHWFQDAMLENTTGKRVHCVDEVYDHKKQNICTAEGFRFWILSVLLTKAGATEWNAPECKSWVFICRATMKRSKHEWEGNPNILAFQQEFGHCSNGLHQCFSAHLCCYRYVSCCSYSERCSVAIVGSKERGHPCICQHGRHDLSGHTYVYCNHMYSLECMSPLLFTIRAPSRYDDC